MSIYLQKYNGRTGKFDLVVDPSQLKWQDAVDTYNDLPITGNTEGDARFVKDTDKAYVWGISNPDGSLSDWKEIGGGASTFLALTDTLNDYSGLGKYILRINQTANGVEAVEHKYKNEIHVAKDGFYDYTSITSALSAISDNAEDNRYVIIVHPGEYDEVVTLKDYIDIVGVSRDTVLISKTITGSTPVIVAGVGTDGPDSTLANLTIEVTKGTSGTPHCIEVTGYGVDFTVDNVRMICVSGDSDGIQLNMSHSSCICNIINSKVESRFDGIDILGKGTINIIEPHVEAIAQDAVRIASSDGADCTVNILGGKLKGLVAGLNLASHNGKLRVNGTLIESSQYSIYGNGGSGLNAQFTGVQTASAWYGVYLTGQTGAEITFAGCSLFGSRNGINIAGSGSIDDVEFHKCIIRTTNEGSYDDILLNNSNANLKLFDCHYDTVTLTNGQICNMPIRTEFHTFADADTSPSVKFSKKFLTNNTGATIITDFDEGVNGQEVFIIFGDGNTTIDKDAGNIKLNGNMDWTPAENDTLTLVYDGTTWFEKCRSDNT